MTISEQILELTTKIESLSDKIELVNGNVQFNINLFWAIIGIIVAFSIVSLVFFAKESVKSGIEKGINETKSLYDDKFLKLEKKYDEEIETNKNEFIANISKLKNDFAVIETGRWSPIIYGSIESGNPEYRLTEGRFYKINNIVILQANVKLLNKNHIKGHLTLGGLPFVSKYTDVYGSVGRVEGLTNLNNEVYLVIDGLISLSIYEKGSNKIIQDSDIVDNFGIYGINMVYEI